MDAPTHTHARDRSSAPLQCSPEAREAAFLAQPETPLTATSSVTSARTAETPSYAGSPCAEPARGSSPGNVSVGLALDDEVLDVPGQPRPRPDGPAQGRGPGIFAKLRWKFPPGISSARMFSANILPKTQNIPSQT